MRIIAAYPGRFQPFGPHHFKVYQSLCSKFGTENVYIVTSDYTDDDRSQLNFIERSVVIQKYGISPANIICAKNVYSAVELKSKFDAENTAMIFVYGEKDKQRIRFVRDDGSKAYFQPYYGQKDLEPYSKHGYSLIAPTIAINHQYSADKIVDSTLLRSLIPRYDRIKFYNMFGWYDEEIHNMLVNKFKSKPVPVTEGSITRTQLQRIEQYADKLFKQFGIDIEFIGTHFMDRLNDPRNTTPITSDELRDIFRKVSLKYGDKLSKLHSGAEGVMKDMQSDVNMPFIIKYDPKYKELDLVPKTIMKKPDFKTPSTTYTVESFKPKFTKHIMHPFEDVSLTFKELFEMIDTLTSNPKDIVATVKLDGQNQKTTFKDGIVYSASNKGEILNPLSRNQLFDKFKDSPILRSVFVAAHDDIQLLNPTDSEKMYYNYEIIHPDNPNVLEYDEPIISIHNVLSYNDDGIEIGKSSSNLIGTIKGLTYTIQNTPTIELMPVKNKKAIEVIVNNIFSEMAKNDLLIDDPIAKLRNNEIVKLGILKIGNIILSNIYDKIDNAVINMQLQNIRNGISKETNPSYREKLNNLFKLWDQLGNQINPIEGFVFDWKGSTYKITGSFAPINMILGFYKYKK